MAESLENSNLAEQTADTGSGNLNEQAEDTGSGNLNEQTEDTGSGNLTEQTADTGSGNLNEQAEDIIFERAITLSTDPVLQLYPLLRKHFHHRQFDQAVKDLEQLELAKYFPDKVPGRATIIERFRTFLQGLPETAEEAKKEKEGALENLEKIVKKIAQRIKK